MHAALAAMLTMAMAIPEPIDPSVSERERTAVTPVVVSVSAPPHVSRTIVDLLIEEADAIWTRDGFRFTWTVEAADEMVVAPAVTRSLVPPLRLRVTVSDVPRQTGGDVMPLGWIVFDDGRPRDEIVISYANALAFLDNGRNVDRPAGITRKERDLLLGRALGRALAHELAHHLLASKAHTLTGLLQASRSASEFFTFDRSRFRLDRAQRARVAARLRNDTVIASR